MKTKWAIPLLIIVLIASGCASLKPWASKSPMEKSLHFFSIYNLQYADTLKMASTPGLSEKQKDVVEKKIAILEKMRSAIWAYDNIVVHGEIPTQADDDAILELIGRLTGG